MISSRNKWAGPPPTGTLLHVGRGGWRLSSVLGWHFGMPPASRSGIPTRRSRRLDASPTAGCRFLGLRMLEDCPCWIPGPAHNTGYCLSISPSGRRFRACYGEFGLAAPFSPAWPWRRFPSYCLSAGFTRVSCWLDPPRQAEKTIAFDCSRKRKGPGGACRPLSALNGGCVLLRCFRWIGAPAKGRKGGHRRHIRRRKGRGDRCRGGP